MGRALALRPVPFGLLTLIVSLEAIFLATFVLISQNRAAVVADMRADLDLQIDLLAEYEVTQLLKLLRGVAEKVGVDECSTQELQDLSRPVVLAEIIKELRAHSAESLALVAQQGQEDGLAKLARRKSGRTSSRRRTSGSRRAG